jgi:hypothetical protein
VSGRHAVAATPLRFADRKLTNCIQERLEMHLRLGGLIAFCAALYGGTETPAAVIISYAPNLGATSSIYPSDFAHGQQLADYFKATADGNVSLLTWWGVYRSNTVAADDFTIRFYAGISPSPVPDYSAAPVNLVRTSTGIADEFGNVIYEYTAALTAAYSVSSGGSYYFSVVNDVSSSNPWAWLSSTSDLSGSFVYREAEGAAWTRYGSHLAFELDSKAKAEGDGTGNSKPEASVPEPCAVLIWSMLAGVVGVGRLREARLRCRA